MPPPTEIIVSGRSLQVTPLTVGHLMEVESRLIAERRDPLATIVARWNDLNEPQRRELLEAAFEHLARPPAATLTELIAWLNSPRGTAYALWLSARERDDALRWEECERLVAELPPAALEEIQQALAPDWWEQTLGNSPGQARPDGVGAPSFAS